MKMGAKTQRDVWVNTVVPVPAHSAVSRAFEIENESGGLFGLGES